MAGRFVLTTALGLAVGTAVSADWPQWLGTHRDAKVTDFKAPATWPKELAKKWSVPVGDGVATPALVGDKLYVFSYQGGNEVTRCLNADTGKEVWIDKYPAQAARGPASGYPAARSSPAVADGKVVTLGVQGALSCLDAATGKKLWRKDKTGGVPGFGTSSSPIIADGLCVAQFGGDRSGGIAAYDLKTGDEKWKWDGDGTKYASPVLLTVDGVKAVVAQTAGSIVAVSLADGKKLWSTPVGGRGGRDYNASTPMVVGQTLVYAGSGSRGTTAVKIEKQGDKLAASDLWKSKDNSVQYNTPILKDGFAYGISGSDTLFCIDAKSGDTVWTTKLKGSGGRGGGYGAVVDAGAALFALNPSGQLVAFAPGGKEFKELASYKVASGGTYGYPVISGTRVFVKDKAAVTLWTFDAGKPSGSGER